MQAWINLAGYQVAWLVTVSGAAHGATWPAWAAATALWTAHFVPSPRKSLDLRLLIAAAVLGVLIDGFLGSSGLLRYSPATPAVPLTGCPLWILGLWLAFSTTLTRSLGWLRGRTGVALLFGAVGGPLAYWAAARGWDVIAFEPPQWRGLLVLSIGWAMALGILVRAAGNSDLSPLRSHPVPEEPDFP